MSSSWECMNAFGRWLVMHLGPLSVELLVLALVVWAVIRLFRIKSPAVRHLFWALVLLKPVASFLWASPVSLYALLPDRPSPVLVSAAPDYGPGPAFLMPAAPLSVSPPAASDEKLLVRGEAGPPAWKSVDRYGLLAMAWVTIAFGFLLRLLVGLVYVAGLKRSSNLQAKGTLADAATIGARALRLRRGVRVALTDRIQGPVLAGIAQPIILFPTSLISKMAPDQLELLIAHELAHARRRDNAWLLLQRLAECLLFFHPAVWICGRMMRREAEFACDSAVLAAFGKFTEYADSLTRIEELRLGLANAFLANTVVAAESNLTARVRSILDGQTGRMTTRLGALSAIALLLVGCLGLPAGWREEDAVETTRTPAMVESERRGNPYDPADDRVLSDAETAHAYAESGERLYAVQTNVEGRAVEMYVGAESHQPFTGTSVKRYVNGQIERTSQFKDGLPDGLRQDWFATGAKMVEMRFERGLPHGPAKEWYANGQIESERGFWHGRRDGWCTGWFEDGRPNYKAFYRGKRQDQLLKEWQQKEIWADYHLTFVLKRGIPEGVFTFWYKTGEKWIEGDIGSDGHLRRLSTFTEDGAETVGNVQALDAAVPAATSAVATTFGTGPYDFDFSLRVFGGIRLGMPVEQAMAILRAKGLTEYAPEIPHPGSFRTRYDYRFRAGGIFVHSLNGRVANIISGSPALRTEQGLRNLDTVQSLTERYGKPDYTFNDGRACGYYFEDIIGIFFLTHEQTISRVEVLRRHEEPKIAVLVGTSTNSQGIHTADLGDGSPWNCAEALTRYAEFAGYKLQLPAWGLPDPESGSPLESKAGVKFSGTSAQEILAWILHVTPLSATLSNDVLSVYVAENGRRDVPEALRIEPAVVDLPALLSDSARAVRVNLKSTETWDAVQFFRFLFYRAGIQSYVIPADVGGTAGAVTVTQTNAPVGDVMRTILDATGCESLLWGQTVYVRRVRPGKPIVATPPTPPAADANAAIHVEAEKPHVVETSPHNGFQNVDPAVSELRFTFSVPMNGDLAWVSAGTNGPVLTDGAAPHWADEGRTCVLPVRLENERAYRLDLNSPLHTTLQSAAGVPLEPLVYSIRTSSNHVRVVFDPNAAASTNALAPIPEKAESEPSRPGHWFYWTFASLGQTVPVKDGAGKDVFTITLVDGDDSGLTLKMEGGSRSVVQHVPAGGLIWFRNQEQDYSMSYPTFWTSPDKPASSPLAVIVISWKDTPTVRVSLTSPYPTTYEGAETNRISVQSAVMQLAHQAGLKYDYKTSLANGGQACRMMIAPEIKEIPLAEALDSILKPVGLGYELQDRTIVLHAHAAAAP